MERNFDLKKMSTKGFHYENSSESYRQLLTRDVVLHLTHELFTFVRSSTSSPNTDDAKEMIVSQGNPRPFTRLQKTS